MPAAQLNFNKYFSNSSYKKFTRGKDISRYSSKDLECIIGNGKKKEKPKEEPVVKAEVGSVDDSYGVDTVAGGLMADYFRKKLVEKGYMKPLPKKEEIERPGDCSEDEVGFVGFGFKMSQENGETEDQPGEQTSVTEPERKKKRKSKSKIDESNGVDNEMSSNQDVPAVDYPAEEVKKKKKHKKAKSKTDDAPLQEQDQSQILEAPPGEKSKKKKRKHEEAVIEFKDCVVENEPIKKKKNKKSISGPTESSVNDSEEMIGVVSDIVKGKKNKRKKCKKAH